MSEFDARADYKPKRDVRDHRELLELIGALPQKGVFWPLVGARRSGKTWTLKALEHQLRKRKSPPKYLDLRRSGSNLPSPPLASCLLLDEPELTGEGGGGRSVAEFLAWCRKLHADGTTILLAMTPAEWALLEKAGADGGLTSPKDLRYLVPLSSVEARKLARTSEAKAILATLPPLWSRSPFLLELVFETAEAMPELSNNLWELLRAARDRSEEAQYRYFDAVFHSGLSEAQRTALRGVACGRETDAGAIELLRLCGLVTGPDARPVFGDPILEANLCPLRIHHVSDIHFGPKSAEIADVKEKGKHAGVLAGGLGRRVCDDYLGHVEGLKASGRAPHVLVISGDIAEWADDAQYADAKAWLEQLRLHLADHPRLCPHEPQLLLVGGNHDVDWRQTGGPAGAGARTRHVPFARAFDGVPRSLRVRLDEAPATRELAVARYPDLGVELLLLGSAEFGGETESDPVRDQLFDLISRLRAGAMEKPDSDAAAALRNQVSRIDPGLVHSADLDRIRTADWRQPVRVAVLHHPVSPLPATELVRFAGLINAGEVKDRLADSQFCLVLHGHAHMGWFGKEQWPGRHDERALWIASAPSLGSRERGEHNGFNEVEIGREMKGHETTYSITVRRHVKEGANWVDKGEMAFAPPGAG